MSCGFQINQNYTEFFDPVFADVFYSDCGGINRIFRKAFMLFLVDLPPCEPLHTSSYVIRRASKSR